MIPDHKTVEGRISSSRFRELPEGHRTTLVVGMIDMLNCIAKYLGPKERIAFEPLLRYAGELTSGELREVFDEYMEDDASEKSYAIAGEFLSMLIAKTGVLK